MKVLVTGATGLIGFHLIERLLSRGDEVTALVRTTSDARVLAEKGVNVVTGDVRDRDAVERAAVGSRIVYHLARAKAHAGLPSSEVQEVNVTGASNVARAATRAGAERIVHCSSAAVYGSRAGRKPVKEETRLNPDSPYARSKASAENALRESSDVPVVIARITSVLGPRASSWLPIFRSALTGKLRLIGNGENRHHPADVSDIADALILCGTVTRAGGRTYNLAGSEHLPVRQMTEMIAAELNVAGKPPRALPATPFDLYLLLNRLTDRIAGVTLPRVTSISFLTADRVLDISRAQEELFFAPRFDVRAAIARTAQWFGNEGLL